MGHREFTRLRGICWLTGGILAGVITACGPRTPGDHLEKLGIPVKGESVIKAAVEDDLVALEYLRRAGMDLVYRDENGRTPLMHAATSGSRAAMGFLVERTGSLEAVASDGSSAMGQAIEHGQVDLALELLDLGAHPESRLPSGEVPVVGAVRKNALPLLKALLARGAGRDLDEALRTAVVLDRPNFAHELLRYGAKPDIRIEGAPLVVHAVAEEKEAMFELLRLYGANLSKTDADGNAALHFAIRDGKNAYAVALLDEGVDPNHADGEGVPPLRRVMINGNRALFEKLVACGADLSSQDEDYLSPLAHAIAARDWELATLLLEGGVNPDAPCRGYSSPMEIAFEDGDPELAEFLLKRDAAPHPLLFHRAVDKGSEKLVDLFLSYDVPIDTRNSEGDTVLTKAVRAGDVSMARHLLRKGADLRVPGAEGQEPLVIAIAAMDPAMTRLLIDAGADSNRKLREPIQKAFREFADNKTLNFYMKRDTRFSPLMVAAAMGEPDVIRILLASGAEKYPYTRRWKRYPISFASAEMHIEAQQLLVGHDPKEAEDRIHVTVDLSDQKATLSKNGVLLLTSRVSTGKKGYSTPTGEYVITHKHRHWNSTLYGSSMPYFMRLSCGAFGLHVGYVPSYPASHGCIRMPTANCREFWNAAPLGTHVSIVH